MLSIYMAQADLGRAGVSDLQELTVGRWPRCLPICTAGRQVATIMLDLARHIWQIRTFGQ